MSQLAQAVSPLDWTVPQQDMYKYSCNLMDFKGSHPLMGIPCNVAMPWCAAALAPLQQRPPGACTMEILLGYGFCQV